MKNLEKLNIEELVELRTSMILEKKSTRKEMEEINNLIDRREMEYSKYIIGKKEVLDEEVLNERKVLIENKKIIDFNSFIKNRR